MRILIFSQHYPPEIGSPANRWGYFAPFLGQNNKVTVITSTPNFPVDKIYQGFKNTYSREKSNNLTIIRCPVVIAKRNSNFKRLLNYFSFVITACFAYLKNRAKYDIVIASCPPLFVGILGYWVKLFNPHIKFILEVRDIWPDSVVATGAMKNKLLLKMGYWLEKFLYKKADFILTNSPNQAEQLIENKNIKPGKIETVLNGIDLGIFENKVIATMPENLENKFIVLYSGNIGPAQKPQTIVGAAEILKINAAIHFILIGAGILKEEIKSEVNKKGLRNIEILDEKSRKELVTFLKRANACLVPYKNNPLFKSNISGKVYEYLAVGCPTIVNIKGAVWELVKKAKAGFLAEPESAESLAEKILLIYRNKNLAKKLSENARNFTKEELDQKIFAQKLEAWLEKIVR